SSRAIQVDDRYVVATQASLDELVDDERLRPDLQGRLEGFAYELRPLRERIEDLGVILSSWFEGADRTGSFTLRTDAGLALCSYEWPLNIRELEQAIRRALALVPGGAIGMAQLPPKLQARPKASRSASSRVVAADEELVRGALLENLRRHEGNVS